MKEFPMQEQFFLILKRMQNENFNMAQTVSDVLGIGIDSAYRRIRSETPLSLDETVKLCLHFQVPLESLNNEIPDVVTFQFNKLAPTKDSFREYMNQLVEQLKRMQKGKNTQIVYAAEDIPLFHHFGFEHLAKFKTLYWLKSILNIPELNQQKFPVEEESFFEDFNFKELYNAYSKIETTEVWTNETIESTLQQIRFYWEAGFFKDIDSFRNVCKDLISLISKIQKQTEINQKINAEGASTGVNFTFYQCDLMIGNNTVLVKSEGFKTTFIGYNSFNFMNTQNSFFNEQNQTWMDNLISKSILMSGVAEKLRNQFFKAQMKKIDALLEEIEKEEN